MNETSRKRKLAPSLSSEYRNVNKNRRPIGMTDALPVHHGKGRSSCDQEVCKNRFNDNCHLREVDVKITVAAALAYRQLLCTQAFCKYSQDFLLNGEHGSTKKLYAFLFQCLPRFISVFNQCVGDLGLVQKLLAVREEKTWSMYGSVPPFQELAYLYCHDLAKSGIKPADLNLCTLCDKKICSTSPKELWPCECINNFLSEKRQSGKRHTTTEIWLLIGRLKKFPTF
jgi:hypothetical protein